MRTTEPGGSAPAANESKAGTLTLSARQTFLWSVLQRYDTYIGTTINRAAAVTALNTLIVGYILLKAGDILIGFHGHVKLKAIGFVGLGISTIAALISTFFSFVALVPYLGSTNRARNSLVFFGDVASRTRGGFAKEMATLDDDRVTSDLAGQVYDVATGLTGKFTWLTRASVSTLLSLVGMLVLGLSVLASYLIEWVN